MAQKWGHFCRSVRDRACQPGCAQTFRPCQAGSHPRAQRARRAERDRAPTAVANPTTKSVLASLSPALPATAKEVAPAASVAVGAAASRQRGGAARDFAGPARCASDPQRGARGARPSSSAQRRSRLAQAQRQDSGRLARARNRPQRQTNQGFAAEGGTQEAQRREADLRRLTNLATPEIPPALARALARPTPTRLCRVPRESPTRLARRLQPFSNSKPLSSQAAGRADGAFL